METAFAFYIPPTFPPGLFWSGLVCMAWSRLVWSGLVWWLSPSYVCRPYYFQMLVKDQQVNYRCFLKERHVISLIALFTRFITKITCSICR